jgi:tape measure domain-containing protein
VSVVANVAINLDARGVSTQLAAIRQTSIGAANGFKNLEARAQAVKSIVEAQQGSFAKASTVQGVFAAKVKNTEFAIKSQIAALRDVQSKVQLNGALYKKAAEQIAKYEAVLKSANNAEQKAGGKFKGPGNVLASLGAGLALRKAFGAASELESAQARIGLLTKNFQQLAGIQDVAANAAKKFNLSQAESLNALTDLGNRIAPTGASLQDVANVYDGFNTLLALNKVNSQNAASATLQLNQALGSGRLAGEEFNAISEATPQLLDAVAVVMGRNRSELKKLASDGKISSDVLIEALTLIKTKGAADLETAFSGAFGSTRRFDAAVQDFSATVGSELLPVITPMINFATEMLKLFGQLPGPVKTTAAAILGLTAAFVALAPAISAAIGLLGGLSVATLLAAGPWIALAAGITAAAVALAGYRTEAEKLGAAAAKGNAADLAAARNAMVQKQQEITLLERQRPSPRSAKGAQLARAKKELAQLERDVATGETATVGTGGITGGGGGGSGAAKGKSDAEKLAEELKRSLDEGRQLSVEFSRQIMLLSATSEIEKKRLQIVFEYQDNQKKVLALKNLEQRNAAQLLIEDIKRRENRELDLEIIKDGLSAFERIAGLDFSNTEGLGARAFGQGGGGGFRTDISLLSADKATQKYDEMRNKLKELTDPINAATTGAQAISGAFGSAFQSIISGAQSTEEALAGVFKNIGESFINMATEILAQMMMMFIFKQLLGLFGGGGGGGGLFSGAGPVSGASVFGSGQAGFNPSAFGGMKLFADGGFVTGPTSAVVGEGGESEYIIPASKMRSAMSRYAAGARGSAVIPAGDDTSSGGGTATMAPAAIDVRYTVERINSVDYVTADQFRTGMAQAAQQGATQGEQRTLRRLQQSRATRSRLGMN